MAKSLVGSRWEDQDKRQGDRVIRIIEDSFYNPDDPKSDREIYVEVEVAQFNPNTIGDRNHMGTEHLFEGYRKISR